MIVMIVNSGVIVKIIQWMIMIVMDFKFKGGKMMRKQEYEPCPYCGEVCGANTCCLCVFQTEDYEGDPYRGLLL